MNPRLRRYAALFEVLGVFLAGGLLMSQLIRLSGIPVKNPLTELTTHTTGNELLTATQELLVLLVFQYAGYFCLIVPIGWWYRRRGPAEYGLTKASRTWTGLVALGFATAALSEWLVVGIGVVNSLHPSRTEPWRQAFFDMSWRRWEFWLFSAVMSWALIPFLEELFFRGYCQRRLSEDWGNGPAIVGAACLFTFEHTQYQIPNAYNVGMVVGLFVSAIGFGVIFAWTRSLLPAVIAHMIFDVPMTTMWQGLVLTGLVVCCLFIWRRGLGIVRGVLVTGDRAAYWTLALAGIACAVAGTRVRSLEYIGVCMVVLAVAIEALDLSSKRRETEAQTLANGQ